MRKEIRLKGYDYSGAGYYFVTICVKDGHELFGEIVGAASCRPQPSSNPSQTFSYLQLTPAGNIVETEIAILLCAYANVTVDKYVVMPNHVHMIICVGGDGRQNAAPTLSRIIGQWKRAISIKLGFSPWQRSYHDHIIRDEPEYHRIRQYIDENPATWTEDQYYVAKQ